MLGRGEGLKEVGWMEGVKKEGGSLKERRKYVCVCGGGGGKTEGWVHVEGRGLEAFKGCVEGMRH
jgi:hypothetical protein